MKQSNIAGIFSATLEKCAKWFLYIFVDPSAPVSKAILNKRARQISLLQLLDRINGVYNFQQLVDIVETGIKKKFNLTPIQVLSVMNQASKKRIAGIGADGDVFTGPMFDGTDWIDDSTGMPLDPEQQADANMLANSTVDGTFWTDFKGIIDWLVEIFQKLGIGKKTSDLNAGTPNYSDWNTSNTSQADISGTIPYVAVAIIGYALWKSTNQN